MLSALRAAAAAAAVIGALAAVPFASAAPPTDTKALRDHHELGQGLGLHLFHHVMTMRLDGSFGRAEFTCDLLVHLSPHYPFKDLSFARA